MFKSNCPCDDCPADQSNQCDRCDLILGIEGTRLLEATRDKDLLILAVETIPGLVGCPGCGVIPESNGRRDVALVDAPWAGIPVRLRW